LATERSGLRDRTEYLLAQAVMGLLGLLPAGMAGQAAGFLAGILYLATPRWRAIAHRNLAMAMPELMDEERRRIIRETYRNLGRVLLALARMPKLTPANISELITYEGFENFKSALEKGKGVLFLTAHLGNWELSAAAHALFGNPMHVMVRPLDNPLLDRWLQSRRTICGNRAIPKAEATRAVLRALKRNEAVGILADQNAAGDDGVFVDVFGIKASATSGVAKIAMKTGAVVIPGFAVWNAHSARYTLKFYPPLELVSTGDAAADLIENTQRCQGAIERGVRGFPGQWLWIHRRWKTRPPGEPDLYA
jgi:KDO2-lipid IV(A) lauroyltransferase